jgi:NADH-quinone oxidoreductase subunit J
METALFYTLAAIALLAAINVLAQRRVFYSALSLIVCLTALSGIYLLLDSPFIAAIQVIVYAGAIMVLFLFVIMLLDPFSADALRDKRKYLGYVAAIGGTLVFVMLVPLLDAYNLARVPRTPEGVAGDVSSVHRLAHVLFSDYLLPFELTSVLILIGIIGAVVLAKRQT